VLGAIIDDVLVDFVGDAVGVPAHAEIADEFEFGAREHFAGGIVGRVKDDGLGVRAKGGGEFPFVKGPVGRASFTKRGVAPERIASGP